MAVHTTPLFPLKSLKGKFGEKEKTIFYTRKEKQCQRAYAFPRDPKTKTQQNLRAVFSLLSKAFCTLTNAERNTWTNYKKECNQNSRAPGKFLFDKSAYISVNLIQYIYNSTISSTAPKPLYPAAHVDFLHAKFQKSTSIFTVEFVLRYLPAGNIYCVFKAGPGFISERRRTRKNEFRCLCPAHSDSILFINNGYVLHYFNNPRYPYNQNVFLDILLDFYTLDFHHIRSQKIRTTLNVIE